MRTFDKIFLSCEHAGNAVPAWLKSHFAKHEKGLHTHRGWDIGILPLAKHVAKASKTKLHYAVISRLVVDLNRSIDAKSLHAPHLKHFPGAERAMQRILERYYWPFRSGVETSLRQNLNALKHGENLLHLSLHSFTPVMRGIARRCDIGILYDPRRKREREFAHGFKAALLTDPRLRDLHIRLNYPYTGFSDCFHRHLRQQFRADQYIAIELEFNQKFAQRPHLAGQWQQIKHAMADHIRLLQR